eukprot:766816-Hanusia_phi.AAC.9
MSPIQKGVGAHYPPFGGTRLISVTESNRTHTVHRALRSEPGLRGSDLSRCGAARPAARPDRALERRAAPIQWPRSDHEVQRLRRPGRCHRTRTAAGSLGFGLRGSDSAGAAAR